MSSDGEQARAGEVDVLAAMRSALRVLYHDLAEDIARVAPACVASGRCCRFREYGHTLFLSEVEADVLLADAPAALGPIDDRACCPWQDANGLCTAREARPMGCRVYFCDPSYQNHGEALSERYIGRLKRLCDERGWRWNYAPLHDHLERAI